MYLLDTDTFASITLANRATLVTRNLRHFKQIPGLKLENWVDCLRHAPRTIIVQSIRSIEDI
jgi:phosphopantetheine adenylyltransferase